MNNSNILLMILKASIFLCSDNYFGENFDEDKNCKREEKIKNMMKTEKERCAEAKLGIE